MLSLVVGQKGRLRSSEREFEIICTHGSTTCIKFHYERSAVHGTNEFLDNDLVPNSDNIIGWGIQIVEK